MGLCKHLGYANTGYWGHALCTLARHTLFAPCLCGFTQLDLALPFSLLSCVVLCGAACLSGVRILKKIRCSVRDFRMRTVVRNVAHCELPTISSLVEESLGLVCL